MENDSKALELYQPEHGDITLSRPPEKVLEEARGAATALNKVIAGKKKPVIFNNEQYLEFEDWQTVGRFYGITAKVRDTKFVQYDKVAGFEASADALLVATGQIISSADAMCLNDEPNWSKKPMFQLRSMSQTRACAKALRNVLAWVVVLAGYRPTPAEEMDGVFKGNNKPANTESPIPYDEQDSSFIPPEDNPAPKQEKLITDPQAKRLYAIARNSGWTDQQIKEKLTGMGLKSSKEIKAKDYDNICTTFSSKP